MQPIQLRENVVFTEKEYEDLFYGCRNDKASLMKLKCVLIKKGFKENELKKARRCDIENFIFNSIVREKVLYYTSFPNEKGVPVKLFYIYNNLVQNISHDNNILWDEITKFVSKRRLKSKTIKKSYFPSIVGMMTHIYGKNSIEDNHIIDFLSLSISHQYIIRGKNLAHYLENNSTSYDGFLCSCPTTESPNFFIWNCLLRCRCCAQKKLFFANDCTIKMGRELLKKRAYNFLLFHDHFKDELVVDVFSTIGHMTVFA
jgi:hypothetical protein